MHPPWAMPRRYTEIGTPAAQLCKFIYKASAQPETPDRGKNIYLDETCRREKYRAPRSHDERHHQRDTDQDDDRAEDVEHDSRADHAQDRHETGPVHDRVAGSTPAS